MNEKAEHGPLKNGSLGVLMQGSQRMLIKQLAMC